MLKKFVSSVVLFLLLGGFLRADPIANTVSVEGRRWVGSGFVYRGKILTAGHLVKEEGLLHVTFFDGRTSLASVTAFDEQKDLAVLDPVLPFTKPTGFTSCHVYSVLDEVYFVGMSNLPFVYVSGVVSKKVDSGFLTDARAFPGDSGSPVINNSFQVIGMLQGVYMPAIDNNYYPGYTVVCDMKTIDAWLDSLE